MATLLDPRLWRSGAGSTPTLIRPVLTALRLLLDGGAPRNGRETNAPDPTDHARGDGLPWPRRRAARRPGALAFAAAPGRGRAPPCHRGSSRQRDASRQGAPSPCAHVED